MSPSANGHQPVTLIPKTFIKNMTITYYYMPKAVFDCSGKSIFFVFSNVQSFVYMLWPIIREGHTPPPLVTWFLLSLLVVVWVYIHSIVWTHEINVSGIQTNFESCLDIFSFLFRSLSTHRHAVYSRTFCHNKPSNSLKSIEAKTGTRWLVHGWRN